MTSKIQINDSTESKVSITLDGNGNLPKISIGGQNQGGLLDLNGNGKSELSLVATFGQSFIRVGASKTGGGTNTGIVEINDNKGNRRCHLTGTPKFSMTNSSEKEIVEIDGNSNLRLGSNGTDGDIVIFPSDATDIKNDAQASMMMNGNAGSISLSHDKNFGAQLLPSIELNAMNSNLLVRKIDPGIDGLHFPSFNINAKTGEMIVQNNKGIDVFHLRTDSSAMRLGPLGTGDKGGMFTIRNKDGNEAIRFDGDAGDIILQNADCAEEFSISPESSDIESGTVMVIDDEDTLQKSTKPYDKRVAGVVSGAGDCKPGIVLDRKSDAKSSVPISLLGKVYCKVDADYSKIDVGDMLTTSNTPGHAMKATNKAQAFGAIIGKALRSVKAGKGLIPVLIALQ